MIAIGTTDTGTHVVVVIGKDGEVPHTTLTLTPTTARNMAMVLETHANACRELEEKKNDQPS